MSHLPFLVLNFLNLYQIVCPDLRVLFLFFLQRIVDNGLGTKNNMISVKKTDFEVFQALEKDSEGISSSLQSKNNISDF